MAADDARGAAELSSESDARQSLARDALDALLKAEAIAVPARAVTTIDDLRAASLEHEETWWPEVQAELSKWEDDLRVKSEVVDRLTDQFARSILQPKGILERLNALLVDKSPQGLRSHINELVGQESEYREVSRIEYETRSALIRSIQERAILPTIRSIINELRASDATNNRLTIGDGSGLDQLLPAGFDLQSPTRSRVEHLIRTLTTASIGIAGPRGSGKTTLLKWFCETRTSDGLQVLITAPVKYEARDYLLYLLVTLCKAILDHLGYDHLYKSASPLDDHPWLRRTVTHLVVTGIGIVAGGATLSAVAIWIYSQLSVLSPGQVEALTVSSVVLVFYLISRLMHKRVFMPLEFAMSIARPTGFSIYERLSVAFGWARFLGGLGVLYVLYAWLTGQFLSLDIMWAALGALGGLMALFVFGASSSADGWDYRTGDMLRMERLFGGEDLGESAALIEEAREKLSKALYQQAMSEGRSDKVGVSASLGVTVSADTTATTGKTMTAVPWTRPELVHEIRDLLQSFTTRKGNVVIGIDEVDKIESRDSAAQFIDDIKGVFGVPRCHYLISVSEDALAAFERRGLPFRTAFDSAFDDVISLDYFTFNESRALLRSRTIALPVRFIGLCHALSGGLPRDLLRVARQLFALGVPIDLKVAAESLIRDELSRKSAPMMASLKSSTLRPWAQILAVWADRSELARLSAPQLLAACSQLQVIVKRATADNDSMSLEDWRNMRIFEEMASFIYFCGTVIQVCDPASAIENEQPDTVVKLLDELARVRQCFTHHPALAWSRLEVIREGVGWDTLGLAKVTE